MYRIIFFFCFIIVNCSEEEQMILRTNWGVHFDKIASVVTGSSTSNFMHAVIIPKPQINASHLTELNCSQLLSTWFEGPCAQLNAMITHSNSQLFQVHSRITKQIDHAMLLVPKINNTAKRYKRGFFKKLGHFFQNILFGSGGSEHVFKNKEKQTLAAMKENQKGIQRFEKSLGSVEKIENDRLSNMMTLLKNLHGKMINMTENFVLAFKNITDEEIKIEEHLQKERNVLQFLLKQIMPYFFSKNIYWSQVENLSYDFQYSIKTMLRGELPEKMISVKYLKTVIDFITNEYSHKPNVYLLNTNPSFYYKQKNIFFGTHENNIIIFIKFPLRAMGSLLRAYRVDSFPVPLTSGLKRGTTHDKSYTLIQNLPKYFLVTSDNEYYMTMSSTLFKSCSGGNIKVCETGTSALQSATSSATCVSAIFRDETPKVNQMCQTIRISNPPTGSAVQLSDNKGFLVHAANAGNDLWNLNCKGIPNTQKPCSMCRIFPPCYCSLSTNDFHIAQRFSGCLLNLHEKPSITYMYHPNLAMITSLHPNSIFAKISANEARNNSKYPALHVADLSVIKFNWTPVVERDNILKENFDKLAKLSMQNITAYKTKIDKIAKNVTDFSDLYLRDTSFIKNLIHQFVQMFGSFGTFVGWVFSSVGIATIGLVLNVLLCTPKLIHCCCCSNKVESHS